MSAAVEDQHQPRERAVNCAVCAHRETWSWDAVCSYCRSKATPEAGDTEWAAEQLRLRRAMRAAIAHDDAAKEAYDAAGEVWRSTSLARAVAIDAFRAHGGEV